jgi:hypothetical protein
LKRTPDTAPAIAALSVLAGVLGCSSASCADEVAIRREEQLKAAYLFNFVKFVEWPASAPAGALTVCFVGGDGVYGAFVAGIENKKASSRPLAARRLAEPGSATGCNVLYLDAAMAPDSQRFNAKELSILTVSDAQGFVRNGGIIELFTDSNRLRFNVNLDNAQKAGLRISSSLLQLAASVEKTGAQ